MRPLAPFVFGVFLAGVALAHEGVKNPAVMARMHGMSEIAADMKTLGDMAKGTTAFDASAAQDAARSIAGHARQTPQLFEADETDPKSEALPAIWTDFADFTAKSMAMEREALRQADAFTSPDALAPGLRALGDTCKACHQIYRQ